MKLSPTACAQFSLRLGLGATYLYSGIDLVLHPKSWYWAIAPLMQWNRDIAYALGIDTFLILQGAAELLFALMLLLWFAPRKVVRLVALLSAVEMIWILVFIGIRGDTFRDIAILGAALALFCLTEEYGARGEI